MTRRTALVAWIAVLLLVAPMATGQVECGSMSAEACGALDELDRLAPDDLGSEVRRELRSLLRNPDASNAILRSFVERATPGALGWLRDINLELKYFDSDESSTDGSAGFSYSFERSLDNWEWAGSTCAGECIVVGGDFSIQARGNVAFEAKHNPDDFLETKAQFAIFGSKGGALERTEEWKAGLQRLILETRAAEGPSPSPELIRSNEERIAEYTQNALSNQFYASLAANVSLESNQKFDNKQYVYGGSLAVIANGWEKLHAGSYAETSTLAKLNLIDYPFAAIRALTNSSSCSQGKRWCFIPLGTSVPHGIVSIALVDPVDTDPRRLAGDGSSFPRFAAEVAFKTPILELDNTPVYATANYRFYQEISAKRSVRAAGLDDFAYFVATVGPPAGLFVSYTVGQLPFDLQDDQVFQIGLRASWDDIAALFE